MISTERRAKKNEIQKTMRYYNSYLFRLKKYFKLRLQENSLEVGSYYELNSEIKDIENYVDYLEKQIPKNI